MVVYTTFLNNDLAEEVYIRLPPDFHSSQLGLVCLLKKSLYGLHQVHPMLVFQVIHHNYLVWVQTLLCGLLSLYTHIP